MSPSSHVPFLFIIVSEIGQIELAKAMFTYNNEPIDPDMIAGIAQENEEDMEDDWAYIAYIAYIGCIVMYKGVKVTLKT